MGSTLGLLALLFGVGFALEGLDVVTGGEVYLASVRQLAEAANAELQQSTTSSSAAPSQQPSPPLPESSPTQPTEPPKPAVAPVKDAFPDDRHEEERPQDVVDPREIQQVLREIRDLQSEIKQLVGQLRKNQAFGDDLAKMNALAAELTQSHSSIRAAASSGGPMREVIQDFRDNQYWDQLNAVRIKVQLPQEIKQIETTLRRLERIIKVKSVRNIGLNIGALEAKIAEMKQEVATAKSQLASGNMEEAQEAMQSFHEGGHPGEIEGTIFRLRDIKQMLKRVGDAEIRAEVDKVLQEVVEAFNAGEYRDARETMDEYADDLQRLIQRFFASRMLRGKNRTESFSKIRNLDALIKAKLEEPDSVQPVQRP